MTENERAMMFELATAVGALTTLMRMMVPEGSPANTPEVDAQISRAGTALQTFIDLVDKEWLPK